MIIEKTKEELSAELDFFRAEIDRKKAEAKVLREKEKALLAIAKEKGISFSTEPYSRSESSADAILSLSNGEPFTVSEIAKKADDLFSVRRNKSANVRESEVVIGYVLDASIRFGIIEKTGKDSYRFAETVSGKKVSNG